MHCQIIFKLCASAGQNILQDQQKPPQPGVIYLRHAWQRISFRPVAENFISSGNNDACCFSENNFRLANIFLVLLHLLFLHLHTIFRFKFVCIAPAAAPAVDRSKGQALIARRYFVL